MGIIDRLLGKKQPKKKRVAKGQRARPAVQRKANPGNASRSLTVRPVAQLVPALQYFEVPRPEGDGVCSDDTCSCKRTVIARGSGYLYISQEAVDFRKDARSVEAARDKANRVRLQMSDMDEAAAVIHGRITAVFLCQKAAERRCLDLVVAAADARHWWETGMAPLRATPVVAVVGGKSAESRPAEKIAEKPRAKTKKPGFKKAAKGTSKKKKGQ